MAGTVVSVVASGAMVAGLMAATAPAEAAVHPATALRVTTTSLPTGTGGTVYSAKLAATGGLKPYTWSITQGSLPPGLTLVPTTGLITGRSTAGGTSGFTVAVTDSENPSVTATAPESITVTVPQLRVTTTALPAATAGVPYSAQLAATGGLKPYTWSIRSGSLPAGLKLQAATGTVSGTPTAGGSSSFTAEVTDGESPPSAANGQVSLSVGVAPLVVTTGGTLPTARPGVPYSVRLGAAGGIKPYHWSVAHGSLPAGLRLSGSGIISGTPRTDGTATFTVQVADGESAPATATAGESLTVATAPAVTTTSLPGGTADQSYSAALTAAGGVAPYTWSVSGGSLPAGLSLDPATGAISGSPTGTGTTAFTVTATDSGDPPATATAQLAITVTALPLAITTASLPTAVLGAPYFQQLTATGGVTPYTWTVSPGSGSLPGGLSLDPATGIISGTPTGFGDSTFTVQVTDSDSPAASSDVTLSIAVVAPLAVTTTSLPTALVGQPYFQTLTSVGGTAPYTWSISSGSLPGGLTLDPATGIISGTPTGTGSSSFGATVTDSSSPSLTAHTQLTINVVTPLEMTTGPLPYAIQGSPYNQQLSASGGTAPYTWSVGSGSLPDGLTLDPATGIISGTPTGPGTSSFTVQVTDSSTPPMQVSAVFTIAVVAPLTITTTNLPEAESNQPYSAQLSATGGTGPYTWSLVNGELPLGLTLNAATGQISGTPFSESLPGFTVMVTDSESPAQTASADEDIQQAEPFGGGLINLPNGVLGQSYQGLVSGIGGILPYSYSISQGSLPPGLTLDPATGAISGTPTQTGDFPFSIEMADSYSPPATFTMPWDIKIAPPLQIVTTSPPAAQQNVNYSFTMGATGGYPPYNWQAQASTPLPPGLTMLSGGQIFGVPQTPGTFQVTMNLTDSNTYSGNPNPDPPDTTSAVVTFTVLPAPPSYVMQRPGMALAHSVWGRLRG